MHYGKLKIQCFCSFTKSVPKPLLLQFWSVLWVPWLFGDAVFNCWTKPFKTIKGSLFGMLRALKNDFYNDQYWPTSFYHHYVKSMLLLQRVQAQLILTTLQSTGLYHLPVLQPQECRHVLSLRTLQRATRQYPERSRIILSHVSGYRRSFSTVNAGYAAIFLINPCPNPKKNILMLVISMKYN